MKSRRSHSESGTGAPLGFCFDSTEAPCPLLLHTRFPKHPKFCQLSRLSRKNPMLKQDKHKRVWACSIRMCVFVHVWHMCAHMHWNWRLVSCVYFSSLPYLRQGLARNLARAYQFSCTGWLESTKVLPVFSLP